jgi:hypothetical protein
MQLRLDYDRRFLRDSFLRLTEDYWIEEGGLRKRLAYVPLDGPLGVNSLLTMMKERNMQKEDERRVLEEAAVADMRLGSELVEQSLAAWNRLENKSPVEVEDMDQVQALLLEVRRANAQLDKP